MMYIAISTYLHGLHLCNYTHILIHTYISIYIYIHTYLIIYIYIYTGDFTLLSSGNPIPRYSPRGKKNVHSRPTGLGSSIAMGGTPLSLDGFSWKVLLKWMMTGGT